MSFVNKSAGKPRPFSRPSVALSEDGPRREWRWVRASAIVAGDNVAQFGVIANVVKGASSYLYAENVVGTTRTFGENEQVYAFTIAGESDSED